MRSDKYDQNNDIKPTAPKGKRKKNDLSEDFLAEFMNLEQNNQKSADDYYTAPKKPFLTEEDAKDLNKKSPKSKKAKKGGKNSKNGKNGKKKRIWPKVIVVLILLLAAIGVGAYFFLDSQVGKMDYVDTNYEEFGIDETVAENLKDYRNIAILGTDERKGESQANSRTDAIVIATIEKSTGKITLTSVMRDTYLLMDDVNGESMLDKATHAHAFGGPVNTCKMLNQSLDLNISEFVVVDWNSVADTVDTLGGIEIEVEENELADLNKWGPETANNTDREWTEVTSTGKQTLDGVQSATYCRIRKTSGGDPGRTERIKKVLTAVLAKAKEHPTKVTELTDKVFPEIQTNMKTKDITSLLPKALKFDINKSVGYPFNYWGGIVNGKWIAITTTLEENNARLYKEVFGIDNYEMSNKASQINQKIISETGITEGSEAD